MLQFDFQEFGKVVEEIFQKFLSTTENLEGCPINLQRQKWPRKLQSKEYSSEWNRDYSNSTKLTFHDTPELHNPLN